MKRASGGAERGTGVFGSTFGFTVFLVFLLFAVQVLLGLYVRTTVTGVAADLARRAAMEGADLDDVRLAALEETARRRLGAQGEVTTFRYELDDVDGDGTGDTLVVVAVSQLPVLLPLRWAGASPSSMERRAVARMETFQEPAP